MKTFQKLLFACLFSIALSVQAQGFSTRQQASKASSSVVKYGFRLCL